MNTNIKDRFLNYLTLRGKRENTIRQYSSTLNILYNYFGKKMNDEIEMIKNISNDSIEDYISIMLQENLSAATINFRVTVLGVFLKYCCKNKKIIPSNPAEGIPVVNEEIVNTKKKIKEVLSEQEVEQLINATYIKGKDERMFELSSARMRFILELGISTGLRIQEILQLTDADLEPIVGEKGVFINIDASRVKNKLDKRVVMLGKTYRYYLEYIEEKMKLECRADTIVVNNRGKSLTTKDFNACLEKLTEKSGLGKHISSHCMRHTFVNILTEKGVDDLLIKRIGGWSFGSDVMSSVYTRDKAFDNEKIRVAKMLTA